MSNQVARPNSQVVLEAARRYLSTGALATELLRPEVYLAWERSHLLGANARLMKAECLSSLETERLLTRQSSLIEAATPYMKLLSKAAGTERHAVMLGDPDAIVLDVCGHEQSIKGPEAVPGPGSLLSEAVAGANGIATPLATNDYTELVGPEHFIVGFHPFSCQGIPLRNLGGETLGVLSISVRRTEVGQRLKEILLCASYGIEAELVLQQLRKRVQQIINARSSTEHLLEKLQQDIIQSLGAGRLHLEVVSRLLRKDKVTDAVHVLNAAKELIREFQQRANLWLELASDQVGFTEYLCLTDVVKHLVELLRVESKVSNVEIIFDCQEAIYVFTDKKSLLRSLLRYIVDAIETVGAGGAIDLKVERISQLAIARISLSLIPAEGQEGNMISPLILEIGT